jgi:hypothetical protein
MEILRLVGSLAVIVMAIIVIIYAISIYKNPLGL